MSDNSDNIYESPLNSDNMYESPLNSENTIESDNKINNNLLESNKEIFENFIFVFNRITEQFEIIKTINII